MKTSSLFSIAVLSLICTVSVAQDRDRDRDRNARPATRDRSPPAQVLDQRFNHNRSYPARGAMVQDLPRGASVIRYRGSPYYFHGGAWYQSQGPRYVVVRPPIGIVVPFLPSFYTTLWIHGAPYYYADDIYYTWAPERNGYIVTDPPADAETSATTPESESEIYVYPQKGQTEEQQATDRYECHRWASDQAGYDPTQPPSEIDAVTAKSKRANYRRAETACLQGRGYSVK
ncbi:DUF6515 family protein [Steroidobacter sp.]|uniref:DUF6515 family protein n=1 Tax=Steroidobacter sp. TaxID=1978227 RepID=UPI001A5A847B|nr:DUF6515 family protein [Steroidobacter sp.]MBL8269813.1 hypothetical protein [Steroidobacter sp.]